MISTSTNPNPKEKMCKTFAHLSFAWWNLGLQMKTNIHILNHIAYTLTRNNEHPSITKKTYIIH
jgi:hypothetical protein